MPPARRRLTTVTPSRSGIVTSRTMTAGGRWATASSASRPPAAVDTAKPSRRSARSRACRTEASSSTTRTSGSGVAEARAPPRAEVLQRVLDLRLVELERLGERGGERRRASARDRPRARRGATSSAVSSLAWLTPSSLARSESLPSRRSGRSWRKSLRRERNACSSFASETPIAFARSARRSPRSPGRGGPCLRSESNASSTLDLLTPSLAARSPARSPRRSSGSGRSFSNAARTLASLIPSASASSLTCSSRRSPLGSRSWRAVFSASRSAAWETPSLVASSCRPAPKPAAGAEAAAPERGLRARSSRRAWRSSRWRCRRRSRCRSRSRRRRARRLRSGRGRCSLPWTSWS